MSASILLSGIDNFDIHLLCIYTKLKYQIFFGSKDIHVVPKSENYVVFSARASHRLSNTSPIRQGKPQ